MKAKDYFVLKSTIKCKVNYLRKYKKLEKRHNHKLVNIQENYDKFEQLFFNSYFNTLVFMWGVQNQNLNVKIVQSLGQENKIYENTR